MANTSHGCTQGANAATWSLAICTPSQQRRYWTDRRALQASSPSHLSHPHIKPAKQGRAGRTTRTTEREASKATSTIGSLNPINNLLRLALNLVAISTANPKNVTRLHIRSLKLRYVFQMCVLRGNSEPKTAHVQDHPT